MEIYFAHRRFDTKVFEKQRITLGGTEEDVVKGGRDLFALLPKAFEGIEKIGVGPWSPLSCCCWWASLRRTTFGILGFGIRRSASGRTWTVSCW